MISLVSCGFGSVMLRFRENLHTESVKTNIKSIKIQSENLFFFIVGVAVLCFAFVGLWFNKKQKMNTIVSNIFTFHHQVATNTSLRLQCIVVLNVFFFANTLLKACVCKYLQMSSIKPLCGLAQSGHSRPI